MGRRSKLIINFTSLIFFKPNINGGDTTPSSSSSSSASSSSSSVSAYSWAWPSCKQAPRTDSFRSAGPVPTCSNMLKSVYFDSTDASSGSLSDADAESEETVIRGLVRSDRLLFEPGGHKSSSILSSKNEEEEEEEEEDIMEVVPFKESVALAVESSDPYGDFRRSMEEMAAAHGTTMRTWECLEELLVWYLRVNGKKNHGFIVAAFVDLLVNLSASASASDHSNENHHEIKVVDDVVASSSNSNSNSPISSSVSFEIEKEGSVSC